MGNGLESAGMLGFCCAGRRGPRIFVGFLPLPLTFNGVEDFLHRNKYLSFRILLPSPPSADDDVRQTVR